MTSNWNFVPGLARDSFGRWLPRVYRLVVHQFHRGREDPAAPTSAITAIRFDTVIAGSRWVFTRRSSPQPVAHGSPRRNRSSAIPADSSEPAVRFPPIRPVAECEVNSISGDWSITYATSAYWYTLRYTGRCVPVRPDSCRTTTSRTPSTDARSRNHTASLSPYRREVWGFNDGEEGRSEIRQHQARPAGRQGGAQAAAAAESKTAGGIVLPDTAKDKPQKGEVVAVGDGHVKKDGTKCRPHREGRRPRDLQLTTPATRSRSATRNICSSAKADILATY